MELNSGRSASIQKEQVRIVLAFVKILKRVLVSHSSFAVDEISGMLCVGCPITKHELNRQLLLQKRQTSVDAARNVLEPQVLEDIKNSTVLVYATHAINYNFNDPLCQEEAGRDGKGMGNITGKITETPFPVGSPPKYIDEIGSCIASKLDPSLPHKLPPLNLTLMWACETLYTTGSGAVNPFLANKLGLHNRAGVAFAGFQGFLNGDLKRARHIKILSFHLVP